MGGGGGGGGHGSREADATPDFTPLIDCMFLLLMFNMFAYVLTGTRGVDVPEASYATGADPNEGITISLLEPRSVGAEAPIILGEVGGREVTPDEIKKIVEDAVADGAKKKIVIKSDKRVPYRDVLKVAQAIASVEGGSLLIAVQPPPK